MLARQFRAALRRKRLKFLVSGACALGGGWHRFRRGPRCSIAEVDAFEARWGISLPCDFRAVLTEVANGCAGPYYGLSPLEAWSQPWQASELAPDQLSRPFDPTRSPERSGLHSGALRICNAGCEHYLLLVVSGPHAGEVWHDAAEDQLATFPALNSNGQVLTFSAWISEWIEASRDEFVDPFWSAYEFSGHALAQVIATATEPLTSIAVDQLPCPACVRVWQKAAPHSRIIVPAAVSAGERFLNPKRAAIRAAAGELALEPLQILPIRSRFLA